MKPDQGIYGVYIEQCLNIDLRVMYFYSVGLLCYRVFRRSSFILNVAWCLPSHSLIIIKW